MKFNYIMRRKDLKKMLMKDYLKFDIIYLMLASIIYFIMVSEIISHNVVLTLAFYLILLIVLSIILYLINLLYISILMKINDKRTNNNYGTFKVTVDDKGICSSGNTTTKVKWTDIKSIKYTKDRIYIKYDNQDKLVFLLNKDFLEKKELFDKIKEEVNKYK